ncbi:MAG: DUF4349 domain-containing protein, partial [Ktedonobacteraceae bacterium]
MSQKQSKGFFRKNARKGAYVLSGLCVCALLLVIYAVSSGRNSLIIAAPNSPSLGVQHSSNSSTNVQAALQTNGQVQATPATSKGSAGDKVTQNGSQYLQKSLQVTMQVQDTRATATALQQWVSNSDPQATSDGMDYEQIGDNQYTVTLTLLVDIDHYTQVETYLRDYAGQKGNMLVSMHEGVQDVTNDYIDTQTRLTDLRAEQQRLLGFLNQAQNLNDTLNIEQQLSQVEDQINSIEAHLNALKGETTFYTVTITLQPVGSALPASSTPGPWSAIPVWQGAWTAVINVWQVVMTLLIWLVAFSVYIIPIGVVAWLV